jgi:di/tricarboxylate transporter
MDNLEIIIRGIIIAENIMLILFILAISVFYFTRAKPEEMTEDEKYVEKIKDMHIGTMAIGFTFLFSVFLAATYANIGKGLTIWNVLFVFGFAIVLAGLVQMLRYQKAFWNFEKKK